MNLVIIVYILIAAIGLTIFRHLAKAYQTRKCFDDEVLNDYFNGRLKREEELRRAVVTHLGVCEKCQQKMYDLQGGD